MVFEKNLLEESQNKEQWLISSYCAVSVPRKYPCAQGVHTMTRVYTYSIQVCNRLKILPHIYEITISHAQPNIHNICINILLHNTPILLQTPCFFPNLPLYDQNQIKESGCWHHTSFVSNIHHHTWQQKKFTYPFPSATA